MLSQSQNRTGGRWQYDRTVLQQREQRRRQAEARKREQERLAKQALQRAQFVAQKRQRMMRQSNDFTSAGFRVGMYGDSQRNSNYIGTI